MHQPLDYPWSGALQPVQVTHRILLPFCLTAIGPVGEQIFTQKPTAVCMYLKIIVPTAPHTSQESQIGDHHMKNGQRYCCRKIVYMPSAFLMVEDVRVPDNSAVEPLATSAVPKSIILQCSQPLQFCKDSKWAFFLFFRRERELSCGTSSFSSSGTC